MNWPTLPLLAAALLALAQPAAAAEDKKASREKEQVKRLQQAQHQLEEERNRLQQEKAQLEAAAKETAEKLAKAEKAAATATSQYATAARELRAAKAEAEALHGKLDESMKREQQSAAGLTRSEGENRKLQASLKDSREEAATCEDKNQALFLRGRELLARIQGQGALDQLLAKEPLFGIKRVEIENTVQEYEDKLAGEKFKRKAVMP